MERQRTLKNVTIGVLLACVLCLSVAFAGFSQALEITGTATVTSATNNWNVKFTSIDTTGTTGYATNQITNGLTDGVAETIVFTCSVKAPGDVCKVNGTITNNGNINALFTGVDFTVNGKTDDISNNVYTTDDFKITFTPPTTWEENTTVLANGDSGNFSINLTVDADAELETTAGTYDIAVTFNFEQSASN